MDFNQDDRYTARQAYVQELYQTWWKRLIKEVLPSLVPCKRWRHVKKNLKRGDVVMMSYQNQMKDDYRIAKVLEVFPDDKGLVRTVRVVYRRRDRREPKMVYWKKPLVQEVVAVQRLAVLQAANDEVPTGGDADNLPLDAVTRIERLQNAHVKLDSLKRLDIFK